MNSILTSIQKEVAPRETKSQTITYRVTPSLKSALREYASAKGVSLQDVLTDALFAYVEKEQKKLR